MFLSIVIPVYNVEDYIKECLDSIIPQIENRNDIEVVIVNDGTKDNSMNIVDSYLSSNAIIKIINQENQGLSQARNNGMKASSGEYIWFVDSDDYLKANAIPYFLSKSKEFPDIDVFASYMDRFIEGSNKYINKSNKGENLWSGKNYLFNGNPKGAAQRFIYKRSFLINNNLHFVPGILHEDGVWGCQMLYCAKSVYFLADSIYVYRIRGNGSIMSNIKIKSAYDLLTGHKILMEFLDKKVAQEDYYEFRKYIFNQLRCILGYCKRIYNTTDYRKFYAENSPYIRNEAKWLRRNGRGGWEITIVSFSPKLLMACIRLRFVLLRILSPLS